VSTKTATPKPFPFWQSIPQRRAAHIARSLEKHGYAAEIIPPAIDAYHRVRITGLNGKPVKHIITQDQYHIKGQAESAAAQLRAHGWNAKVAESRGVSMDSLNNFHSTGYVVMIHGTT
jgi:uracil DNA glycosylase